MEYKQQMYGAEEPRAPPARRYLSVRVVVSAMTLLLIGGLSIWSFGGGHDVPHATATAAVSAPAD